MRIAVIGTGISGMTAAYLVHPHHEIAVFEAADRVGGHAHTVDVDDAAGRLAVDTGFIVCNDRTYPNFLKILSQIGVAPQPSDMSFSVRCDATGLEYSGGTWNGLFAQRRNLLRPSFYRMLAGIVRFNREALRLLEEPAPGPALGDYLRRERYGEEFVERYVLPMGAAIWSSTPSQILEFPARSFVEFFRNHGLLEVFNRPQWFTIPGGSRTYVQKLTSSYRDRIRLSTPVLSIRRDAEGALVRSGPGEERFDHVILATHSDQALRMLVDATPGEREILSALPYQENDAVLHCDTSAMPKARRAWSSWNSHLPAQPVERATVTYWMNRLQRLTARKDYYVTLNRQASIAPNTIVGRYVYHHPVFRQEGVAAQKRWSEVSGKNRVSFCGAYWGYGFHEDGVNSALRAVEALGGRL